MAARSPSRSWGQWTGEEGDFLWLRSVLETSAFLQGLGSWDRACCLHGVSLEQEVSSIGVTNSLSFPCGWRCGEGRSQRLTWPGAGTFTQGWWGTGRGPSAGEWPGHFAGEGSIILEAWRGGRVQTQPALPDKMELTLLGSWALPQLTQVAVGKTQCAQGPTQGGADVGFILLCRGSERAGHSQRLPAYMAGWKSKPRSPSRNRELLGLVPQRQAQA